jgi:IS5 family transposase
LRIRFRLDFFFVFKSYGRVEKQAEKRYNLHVKQRKKAEMKMNTEQLEMVSVEQLIPQKHTYRKLKALLDFTRITKSVKLKESEVGAAGYGKQRLVLCLILQFMEDLSDREFERFIAENIAGKWFCGFGLCEKTPDFTTVCKFRNLIGTSKIGKLFHEVKRQLQAKNYCSEVFTFVDSTALVSKLSLWEERDKAIAEGYEKLNNEVLPEVSADPEAKIGAKSSTKFWYGFKKHVAVDMKSGMITKVAVTPANVTDADGVKHVLPGSGAVVGDKGFVSLIREMRRRGLHSMVISRNNMKEKNADLDRWISKLRSPYEGTFSKQNTRVRYKGVVKNQGAEFLYAIAFNFRKLLMLNPA